MSTCYYSMLIFCLASRSMYLNNRLTVFLYSAKSMMDKKAMMLEMLQADFARLMNQEPKEFAKALQEGKDDTVIYMHALISQMSSSGTLLVKTPKFPKTRNTRVTTIREKDELDFVENSLYTNTSGSSSSRDMILETSDLRPVRPKRGASVKATEIIRQQCASLNTKVGRPGRESDVSLPNRVCSGILHFTGLRYACTHSTLHGRNLL